MPQKRQSKQTNAKKGSKKAGFFQKLIPRTKKSQLLTFIVLFALIGGGYYAYSTYARTNLRTVQSNSDGFSVAACKVQVGTARWNVRFLARNPAGDEYVINTGSWSNNNWSGPTSRTIDWYGQKGNRITVMDASGSSNERLQVRWGTIQRRANGTAFFRAASPDWKWQSNALPAVAQLPTC